MVYSIFFPFFTFVSILIYFSFSKYNGNIRDIAFLVVSAFLLICLMGLRSVDVATDTRYYSDAFLYFGQNSLFGKVPINISGMPGYRALSKVVYLIAGGRYQWMLIITSIIIIFGFFRFIYYASENVWLSVFLFIVLYIYFSTWNASRQYLAISIFLNSFIEYRNEKKILSFLLLIFSVLIHPAVIVLAVLFLFCKVKWSKRKLILFFVFVVFSLRLSFYILETIAKYYPRFGYIYSGYLKTGVYNNLEVKGRRILISFVFLVVILIALLILKPKEFNHGFINLWTILALVLIEVAIGIFASKDFVLLRIQSFFSFFSIIMIPNIFNKKSFKKYQRVIELGVIYVFTIPFIVLLLGNNSGVLFYRFFGS